MIKAGIWDLGGVLFTNGTKSFIKKISTRYDFDSLALDEIMDGELGSKYREDLINRDEFWNKAMSQLKITAKPEDLNNEWFDEFQLIDGTRDIIIELIKKIPQYYFSDNIEERVDYLNNKTGFLNWFDGGLFSYEFKMRKPDPKFYQLILQKAGVRPEEAFFVDDKEQFLIPARKMGINTILFTTPEDCRLQLNKLGLLI